MQQDSGQEKKKRISRPLWPEYRRKKISLKRCLFYSGGKLYGSDGREEADNAERAVGVARILPCIVYVDTLNSKANSDLLENLVYTDGSKVISDRKGNPICSRVQAGRKTSWFVSSGAWGFKRPDQEFVRNMEELFQYYGLGVYPTPSSLGTAFMRDIHFRYTMRRNTALSLACETYIRNHSVGGIVQTPGMGMSFDRMMQMDQSSAYVAKWGDEEGVPEGGGIFFTGGNVHRFHTYFAECSVFLPHDLELGPFPVRLERNYQRQVCYPNLSGVYDKVYLWKEQVDDIIEEGGYVKIKEGYGWYDMTHVNAEWAYKAHEYRKDAPTEFIKYCSKRINVAAIGYHGMGREHYSLVPESEYKDGDRVVCSDKGEPLNMYVRKEDDSSSAHMNHWHSYTVMKCNRSVYKFALPYAKENRLAMIDYDSVYILEKNEREYYISKKSVDALNCKPGTWLYLLHTNFKVLNHRSFTSDQDTKKPGVKRDAA